MKPAVRSGAAWLGGLVLSAACVCASAQETVSRPAAEANETRAGLSANIPLRRDAEPSTAFNGQWAVALWGLLVLGGVAWVVVVRRRRAGPAERPRSPWAGWLGPVKGSDTQAPQVLSQTRLSPRHSLHTVQWHGVQYLIACSDQGTQLIAQHPGSAHPALPLPQEAA